MKLEYIYGIHPVREAIKSTKRNVLQLYVMKKNVQNRVIEDIVRLAKRKNIKIDRIDGKVIERITKGGNHQGVLVKTEAISNFTLYQALDNDIEKSNTLWVAVDKITDPQNLGSIIRSASCLGFSTIVIPQSKTTQLTSTVYKTACGAIEKIKIVSVANLNTTIIDLKKKGFWIYGSVVSGKCISISKIKYNTPALLIIGGEEKGLKPTTIKYCDEIISIPHRGGVESLNASSAGAILMYDIYSKTILK